LLFNFLNFHSIKTAVFFEIIDELFIDRHIGRVRKKTAVILLFLSSDDERLEPKFSEKTHILLRCFNIIEIVQDKKILIQK
jgi:hypothetical protein